MPLQLTEIKGLGTVGQNGHAGLDNDGHSSRNCSFVVSAQLLHKSSIAFCLR